MAFCTHCVILNRYITVGRGICKKYQSRDGQIMSRDWNFLQILHTTVIYLFNYTEYTFVPRRMRLQRKEFHGHETPSFSSGSIFFFFMRMQQERVMSSKLSAKEHTRVKKANTKMQIPPAEGKNGKFIGKYPRGTKIVANSPWLLDNREICFKYTCNGLIKTKYFLYNM